jgi:hypothetical protein
MILRSINQRRSSFVGHRNHTNVWVAMNTLDYSILDVDNQHKVLVVVHQSRGDRGDVASC